MTGTSARGAAVLSILLAAGGCRAHGGVPLPGGTEAVRNHRFAGDATLDGTYLVAGEWVVPRGVTLTLLPGTRLLFVPEDRDGDGLGDARLRIEGRLVAAGLAERPVTFTSAGAPGRRAPGDWDSLLFNFSRGSELRHAVIEYANYALHAHFSTGRVSRSRLWRNYEGCRMGNCDFLLEENLVRENVSKGFNFHSCANTVRANEITANGNGVFVFEKDAGTVISGNNIYGNERYDFRADDFFRGEMLLEDNWWGSADEEVVRRKVYDRRHDPEIGAVRLRPATRPHAFPWTIPAGGEGEEGGA